MIALVILGMYWVGWVVTGGLVGRWCMDHQPCPPSSLYTNTCNGHAYALWGCWGDLGKLGRRGIFTTIFAATLWPLLITPILAYYAAKILPSEVKKELKIRELEDTIRDLERDNKIGNK